MLFYILTIFGVYCKIAEVSISSSSPTTQKYTSSSQSQQVIMATHVTDGPSELFSIRNALYLGNYSAVVQKASQQISSADIKPQRDALLYRAHIALGDYDLVLSQVQDNDSTSVALRVCSFIACICCLTLL
jgi:biopolymer transport protein ExbD